MIVTDKLSTESFHAFIDEQLTDEQYVQVEAQLDEIPEKIEEIQQCQIINERLREVFDPIVEEPLPDDLLELGFYGIAGAATETDSTGYDDLSSPFTELEDDIAAIDSLDTLPEEDHSYIDEYEASDLEVLAQTEHLSGFDIDALHSDGSNIIPDIFDESENQAGNDFLPTDNDTGTDPTDDLLESIDTLSLELEKAHSQINAQVSESSLETEPVEEEPTARVADQLEAEGLDLEPLYSDEQEGEEQQETDFAEDEQLSAKEKVLETLATDELSLEPLENIANEAFVQEQEGIGEEEATLGATSPQKVASNRPRNLRGDQAEKESLIPKDDAGDSDALQAESISQQNKQQTTQNISQGQEATQTTEKHSDSFNFDIEPAFNDNVGTNSTTDKSSPDNGLPEDLVAEFFSQSKTETDFEVNEVVRQFGEVSDNFSGMNDDRLFDDDSTAGIKSKTLEFVGATTEKINELKLTFSRKKTDLLKIIKGNKADPDFSRSPFAGSSDAIDALDLSSFDGFDKAPESAPDNFDIGLFEHAVTENKNKKDKAKAKEVSLKADSFSEDDIVFNFDEPPAQEPAQEKKPENQSSTATDMTFNFGFEDEPAPNNLVNKIGDTLRNYKEKIVEMRQENAAEETANGFEANSFDKLKNSLLASINNVSLKANAKMLGAAVLVAGLLVVGLVVSLSFVSENAITNKGLENLAIDTHLLNTQFSNKLVADADSTIIEKLQWFSARIGHKIRLADIRIEDFEHKQVTVMPTMASYASSSIFENKAGQRMTLMVIPDVEGAAEAPITCRIPENVDGLCVWVKDSVRYIVVANLSLSRVRSFSQQVIEKL